MALTLKINVSQGASKTMRFTQDMSVAEAIGQIKERVGLQGASDHGLYQPPGPRNGTGKWLKENRLLQYYNFANMDELDFKKKTNMVKVKLMDETIKTVLLDTTQPVKDMIKIMTEKFSISNGEEYSLQAESHPGEWLQSNTTLDEQNVPEGTILVLKKRFFYSDNLLDKEDPVSLHLLYVQSRDAVLNGEYSVTKNEAVELASLLCQVLYGNYDPNRKIEVKNVLPLAFRKEKAWEKDIVNLWKKASGLTETSAKYKYVQTVRFLKTYGISTFDIKLPNPDKKTKPVKAVLGVTRESILIMDYETKAVKKQWPLTHLRRWAASAATQTFTLDFGDHERNYMTLITTNPEPISQLISGYIDIILKSRRDAARMTSDDTAQVAQIENVGRVQAFAMPSTTMTTLGTTGIMGSAGITMESIASGAQPITLASGASVVERMIEEISAPVVSSAIRTTSVDYQAQFIKSMDELNEAARGLLVLGDAPQGQRSVISRSALDTTVQKVGVELAKMMKAARGAASASDEDDDSLLNGTKALAEALKNMMSIAEMVVENPSIDTEEVKSAMKANARAYQAGVSYIQASIKQPFQPNLTGNLVLESGKQVAQAIAGLLDFAQQAYDNADADRKEQLLPDIETLKKFNDVLLAETKTLGPALVLEDVRTTVRENIKAAEVVAKRVLVAARVNAPKSDHDLSGLNDAAKQLSQALAQLVTTVDSPEIAADDVDMRTLVANFRDAVTGIRESIGDRARIMSSTKTLATVSNDLINAAKAHVKAVDSQTRQDLLQRSQAMADAVAALVSAARASAQAPSDGTLQQQFEEAVRGLENTGQDLTDQVITLQAVAAVRSEAKQTAARGTHLVTACRRAAADVKDVGEREALLKAAQLAADAVEKLVDSLHMSNAAAHDANLQSALVAASQATVGPIMELVARAKRNLIKIDDIEKKKELKDAAEELVESMQALVNACNTVNAASVAADQAVEETEATISELDGLEMTLKSMAVSGIASPAPHRKATRDSATADLNAAMTGLIVASRELDAIARDDPRRIGRIVTDIGKIMSQVPQVIKSSVTSTPDKNAQRELLEGAKRLSDAVKAMLEAARTAAANPAAAGDLPPSVRAVSEAAQSMMEQTGSSAVEKAEAAAAQILATVSRIDEPSFANSAKQARAMEKLSKSVTRLAQMSSQLVSASSRGAAELAQASTATVDILDQLMQAARELNTPDDLSPDLLAAVKALLDAANALVTVAEDPQQLAATGRNLAIVCSKLVQTVKKETDAAQTPLARTVYLQAMQPFAPATGALLSAVKEVQQGMPDAKEKLQAAVSGIHGECMRILQAAASVTHEGKSIPAAELPPAVRTTAKATAALITAAVGAVNKNRNASSELTAAAKSLSDALATLSKTCDSFKIGEKEYQVAVSSLESASSELSNDIAAAAVGGFAKVPTKKSLLQCQADVSKAAKKLGGAAEKFSRIESRTELASLCDKTADRVGTLLRTVKAATSQTPDSIDQQSLLSLTKDLADAQLSLIQAVHTYTENMEAKQDVTDSHALVMSAVDALVSSLSSNVTMLNEVDSAIESIEKDLDRLDKPLTTSQVPYGDTLSVIESASKTLTGSVKQLMLADKTAGVQLPAVTKQVAANISNIVRSVQEAAGNVVDADTRRAVVEATKELLRATTQLVQVSKTVAVDPKNIQAKTQASKLFTTVTAAVAKLLETAKQGDTASTAVSVAMDTVGTAINELDAAALFAAAGTLDVPAGTTPAEAIASELALTDKLSQTPAALLTASKESFGTVAKQAATHTAKLVTCTKAAAALLGPAYQQDLITAAKGVALALQGLMAGQQEAQKQSRPPSAQQSQRLAQDRQEFDESLKSLVDIVKNAESTVVRGLQALADARSSVQKSLQEVDKASFNPPKADAADILSAARHVAGASAALVQAKGNQEVMISASQSTITSTKDLLARVYAAAKLSTDPGVQKSLQQAAKAVVQSMAALIDALQSNINSGLAQQQISAASTAVADRLSELIVAARPLPGGSGLKLEEVGNDAENLASIELEAVAKAIDQATAALREAKDRSKATPGVALDFQVSSSLEDAIGISGATHKLVRAAAVAQQERLTKQSSNPIVYRKDPMWANGLISAAKNVAGCTQQLVISADKLVTGQASEEELIVVARSIAAATAQLVAASSAKAEKNSTAHNALSGAAREVTSATTKLINATLKATQDKEEQERVAQGQGENALNYTGAAIKELEAQMRILKLEKELQDARNALLAGRSRDYRK